MTSGRRALPAELRPRRESYYYTLNDVAAALGVSRSSVQQIERCALQKVKAAFEARGITAGYLDAEHTPEHWPPDLPG